jgi:hypothetical protein
VRSLEFHPEAQAELIAAAQYFEREAENLGVDFLDFVQRTAVRLSSSFPKAAVASAAVCGVLWCHASFSCFCIA